jgi:hypothetical protein
VQQLYLDLRAIARQSEYVPVHELGRHHRLVLHGPLDRDQTVTQTCGFLEALTLYRFAHARAEILDHVLGPSAQE